MYHDVRGPDGRKLFRFDPERLLIEIMVKGQRYTVDITPYMNQLVTVIEIIPARDESPKTDRQGSTLPAI